MGWKSSGASGWPGTDWVEQLLLASAGPDTYDAWTAHDIPFDSPPVRDAFARLAPILFMEGSVAKGAVEQPFTRAQRPMLKDPPECWLYSFPSFADGFIPDGSVGSTTKIFPFPSASGGIIGGGDQIAVFSDRPEVRALVRYLLSPSYGEQLAGHTTFISPNRGFDSALYQPFEMQQAKLIRAALATDSFRFDASDLMPPPIGDDLFWAAMMRYAREGSVSLDAILSELDAAWPDDG